MSHPLLTAKAVRKQSARVAEWVKAGKGYHFEINEAAMESCADFVARVCKSNYPNLKIPLHSRWRHFQYGEFNLWRLYEIKENLNDLSPKKRCQCAINLAFVSVLLDAGAGRKWSYIEPNLGVRLERSEGLAAASVHFFFNHLATRMPDGRISLDPDKLIAMNKDEFCRAFQVTSNNSLIGISGRVNLLNRLGQILKRSNRLSNPGDLVNVLTKNGQVDSINVAEILPHILINFNRIWPHAVWHGSVCIGDAGHYFFSKDKGNTPAIIPFHKLSQWLSYSLIEPLQWLGLEVHNLDGLTGLPEYRNGGLFIDMEVLHPKNPAILNRRLSIESEEVVEWRALTVSLIDEISHLVRMKLNRTKLELPLSSILEGGTWAAGRKIAAQMRDGATPPIRLAIDGTVF